MERRSRSDERNEAPHSPPLLRWSASIFREGMRMTGTYEFQIRQMEDKLRTAMLQSDISTLEALLAPDLVFTNHLGHVLSRDDDLQAHRSGLLKIDDLRASDQKILVKGNIAIVSVRTVISGIYDGHAADGEFRFTRIWMRQTDVEAWHVISANSVLVS
jgi:ketosteroid isomerase-like protein